MNWLAQREDQNTGYFVECDLEYHAKLQDSQNVYPLGPVRVAVTPSVLSEKQVEVKRHYSRGLAQMDVKLPPVYSTRCAMAPTTSS